MVTDTGTCPAGLSTDLLLYDVHVADVPRRSGIEISQFADGIAADTSNKHIVQAVSSLQRFMSDLETWLCKRIRTNVEKLLPQYFQKEDIPRKRMKLSETDI
jgi:hypothetical protein